MVNSYNHFPTGPKLIEDLDVSNLGASQGARGQVKGPDWLEMMDKSLKKWSADIWS